MYITYVHHSFTYILLELNINLAAGSHHLMSGNLSVWPYRCTTGAWSDGHEGKTSAGQRTPIEYVISP